MSRRGCLGIAAALILAACNQPESTDPSLVDQPLAELAGTYTRGAQMTWIETLTIDADGRFDRNSHGHSGATRYSGTASREGDWIILHGLPDHPTKAKEIEAFGFNHLRIVPWGDRTYLIEEDLMRSFCESVNWGWEPRDTEYGNALLRDADWLTATTGLPDVSPEWSSWVLRDELTGTVTEVGDDWLAYVDLGADDGLLPGMTLIVRDVPTFPEFVELGAPPSGDAWVEVTEVEAQRCLVQPKNPMRSEPLQVGMRVTSRASRPRRVRLISEEPEPPVAAIATRPTLENR